MEAIQTVAEIVIPGAGPVLAVLKTIYALCVQVKEGKETCLELHDRLRTILVELDKRRLPPSDAIPKFKTALATYWRFLRDYREMSTFDRILHGKKFKLALASIQDDIQSLFQMLELATAGVIMEWRQAWEVSMNQQQRNMEVIMANEVRMMEEMRDTRLQVESMMLLKHEIDKIQKNVSDQSADMQKILRKTLTNIVRTSKAVVPKVPDWFLADTEIKYDAIPFALGSCGTVHHGTWGAGVKIVVKLVVIPGGKGFDAEVQLRFLPEADMWFSLRHPHVIKMYGACHVTSRPFIVCDDASTNGNLTDYVAKSAANKARMWWLFYEAALGLSFLHSKGIIHGDVKASNILIADDGKALVSDFGFSRVKAQASSQSMTRLADGTSLPVGFNWLAPERFAFYAQKESDVFSLAMCMIEVAQDAPPFATLHDDQIKTNILAGILPPRPRGLSDAAWKLIQEMTKTNPKDRIFLADVIVRLKALAEQADEEQVSGGGESLPFAASEITYADHQSLPVKSIPTLLADLQHGSSLAKTSAAKQLYRYCITQRDACAEIYDLGAIQLLVSMAKDMAGSYHGALYASGCLRELCGMGNCGVSESDLKQVEKSIREPTQSDLEQILDLFRSQDTNQRDEMEAAEVTTLAARVGTRHQDALHGFGVMLEIVQLVQVDSRYLRGVAATALAAMLANEKVSLNNVAGNTKIITSLIKVLGEGTAKQKRHALAVLMAIAKGADTRKANGAAAGSRPLLDLLLSASETTREHAASVLASFASSSSSCRQSIGMHGGIPLLVGFLQSGSNRQQTQAVQILAQLALEPTNAVMLAQAGGVQLLITLGSEKSGTCSDDALRVVAMLAHNSYVKQAMMADADVLQPLVALLQFGTTTQQEDAAFAVHSVIKNNLSAVHTLEKIGGMECLVELTKRGSLYAGPALHEAVKCLLQRGPGDGDRTDL